MSLTFIWLSVSILLLYTNHSTYVVIFLKHMLDHLKLQLESFATSKPEL